MKNKNFVFNLIQAIFTLVGIGMLAGGYLSKTGSQTSDGFPLDRFFYGMGAFFILWPALLFGVIKYFRRRAAARVEYLKLNGLKGKARVLGMRRTNLTVNNIPQMMLDLNITTSLGETYRASYKKCVEPLYYNIIRPETDLPVYIDPNNKEKIYVDFEEAWAKSGGVKLTPFS